jgi:hypothetical protein
MKILVIGQPDSPHTLSFLQMVKQVHPDGCINLFPSSPFGLNSAIASLCDHCYEYLNPQLKYVYHQAYWDDLIAKPLSAHSGEPKQLMDIITEYQPDFVHVNAMQDAGYLLSKAFELGLTKKFKLIYSIWGLDIHAFMHNPAHCEQIKKFLSYVDLIVPESSRELELAKNMGYRGKFTDLVEATLVTYEQLLSRLPQTIPAKENLILVKSAFQTQRTNNGVFLKALANCLDLLENWSLIHICPSLEDYKNLQEIAFLQKNFNIEVFTSYVPHQLFLELLSRAKYMTAINISDGVSNTFLESCAAMTYPILSSRASMEDWYSSAHNNVIQLDPYNVIEATKSLRQKFSDHTQWELSVKYNKAQLERYSDDKVKKIVKQFYR